LSELLAQLGRRLQFSPLAFLLPAQMRGNYHRAAADLARDGRDWSEAAAQYEKCLVYLAHRHDLWVQLGNMRKEMGDLSASRAAYDAALALAPEDSDLALQLGHLAKIQGRVKEARQWYRKALELDPRNYHASEELVGLGEEWEQIAQLVAGKPKLQPALRKRSVVVAADVTEAWECACRSAQLDRGGVWFLELARAIAGAHPRLALTVRSGEGQGLSVLSEKAVSWLVGLAGSVPEKQCRPDEALRGELSFEHLVLLAMQVCGVDGQAARAVYRRLRGGKLVTVMAAFPPISELASPPSARSSLHDSAAALLEQATLAVTTSDRDAEMLRFVARRVGGGTEIAVLAGERGAGQREKEKHLPASDAGAPETATTAPSCRVFVPSADFVVFQQVIDAWTEQAGPGGRLRVLVEQPSQEERELIGVLSRQYDVDFAACDPTAVRALLAAADSVLVADVRGPSLLWIQDALELGVRVVAGVSPAIYKCWGAAISDYCNLADRKEIARRWLATRSHGTGRPARRASPSGSFPWVGDARRLFARLVEETTNGGRGVAGVEIAIFYAFSDRLSRDSPGDLLKSSSHACGNHLLTGAGWHGASLHIGSLEAPALVEFFARDQVAPELCFACPVAAVPGAGVTVRAEEVDGSLLSETRWTAPASGRGWIVGRYPTRAAEGTVTAVRLGFALTPPAETQEGEDSIAAPLVVGGLFIFPSDLDRYWYQFLETQSDGLLPAPVVMPGAGDGHAGSAAAVHTSLL
jgi:tetratricopeptide (TPR) repeat protein